MLVYFLDLFVIWVQIVDLSIFMKPHSVKCADVDFDEIKLVDCRQERQIWCNLHLVRPH